LGKEQERGPEKREGGDHFLNLQGDAQASRLMARDYRKGSWCRRKCNRAVTVRERLMCGTKPIS
jgi:hypothetical protein